MKQAIGSMVGGIAFAALLGYGFYIANGDRVCGKIDRGSEIVKWTGQGIEWAAKPWAEVSTMTSIRQGTVRARLGFARFLQRYNNNQPCDWDLVMPPSEPAFNVNLPKGSDFKIPDLPKRGELSK